MINLFNKKKRHPLAKESVLQFTKDWKFIREWDYAEEIYKELKINWVRKVCKWIRYTAWGFIWKFKKNAR